jgi:hypothetical protein
VTTSRVRGRTGAGFADAICSALVLIALSACKPAAAPGTAGSGPSHPTFVVTFASTHCEVSGPRIDRRAMPCRQVVEYVVHELKLSTDAPFDVATIPDVDTAEFDRTMAALKDAGFRMTPGVHVNFLTEPKHNEP